MIKEILCTGKKPEKNKQLDPYLQVINKLSLSHEGFILQGSQIVVPKMLIPTILKLAYHSHQGIVKTKQLLCSKVWFPSMDKAVEELIQNCHKCKWTQAKKFPLPLKMSPLPLRPWAAVTLDFAQISTDKYLLIVLDMYSKFPFIKFAPSTSFHAIENALDQQFSIWGLPETIYTNNGPPFTSAAFKQYLEENNITHRPSIPLWPQSNGQVERFIRSLKKTIKINQGIF